MPRNRSRINLEKCQALPSISLANSRLLSPRFVLSDSIRAGPASAWFEGCFRGLVDGVAWQLEKVQQHRQERKREKSE